MASLMSAMFCLSKPKSTPWVVMRCSLALVCDSLVARTTCGVYLMPSFANVAVALASCSMVKVL